MSTYVMGEIHGCYREFKQMMKQIEFSDSDRMFLVGDSIDRGPNSFEMLKWLENCPKNVRSVKGNHDVDFAEYVKIMKLVDAREGLETDPESNEETKVLYDTVNSLIEEAGHAAADMAAKGMDPSEMAEEYDILKYTANIDAFDKFGTINDCISLHSVNLKTLNQWAFMLSSYPYFYRFTFKNKEVVIVHAGYPALPTDIPVKFKSVEDFYLHAREESVHFGGIRNGIIVAGHTPTIARKMFCFTGGRIYKHTSERKTCVFYNVDCGCAYREVSPFGKMCCLKLDDETTYYL